MEIDVCDLYEFYLKGYENTAYTFGYVPEFKDSKTIEAYVMGSIDGRTDQKKDFECFIKKFQK
jgi:hypothetical protein